MNQLSSSSAFNYFDWHVALRGCLMASHAFELQENLSQLPWSPGSQVIGLSLPLRHPPPQPLDHWQSLFPISGSWCAAFSPWNACPPFCSSPWLTLWVFFSRPSSNMATSGIPWSVQSPCTPARSQESLLHAPGTLPTSQHLAPGSQTTDGPASLFHCTRKSQEVRTLP